MASGYLRNGALGPCGHARGAFGRRRERWLHAGFGGGPLQTSRVWRVTARSSSACVGVRRGRCPTGPLPGEAGALRGRCPAGPVSHGPLPYGAGARRGRCPARPVPGEAVPPAFKSVPRTVRPAVRGSDSFAKLNAPSEVAAIGRSGPRGRTGRSRAACVGRNPKGCRVSSGMDEEGRLARRGPSRRPRNNRAPFPSGYLRNAALEHSPRPRLGPNFPQGAPQTFSLAHIFYALAQYMVTYIFL